MNKTLLLALISLLAIPSAASAATVTADIDVRGGTEFGPVTFRAAKGEVNAVTITTARGLLRFRDAANRLRASGDCKQVDRHTATCPTSEDPAEVFLGNRSDRANVGAEILSVFGGDGNDLLRGTLGGNVLDGQRGNDTLYGGDKNDTLTGGPGRDRVYGGRGDDDLVDGETDAQASRDLYRGGSSIDTRRPMDQGDTVSYALRKRSLDIDLSRGKAFFGREGDVVRGLESIIGGRGGDKLSGDGDENWIEGGRGNDRLRGRGGADLLSGDRGDDRVSGDDDNDYVSGDGGTDQISGGEGDDQVTAADSVAETANCGPGQDWAPVTRLDTLQDCEVGSDSRELAVSLAVEVQGNTATFAVACLRDGGCSGTLTLTSLTGEAYGSGQYTNLPHGADVFNPVEVDLTPAGKEALRNGEVMQVLWGTRTGGFRAFLQGG